MLLFGAPLCTFMRSAVCGALALMGAKSSMALPDLGSIVDEKSSDFHKNHENRKFWLKRVIFHCCRCHRNIRSRRIFIQSVQSSILFVILDSQGGGMHFCYSGDHIHLIKCFVLLSLYGRLLTH